MMDPIVFSIALIIVFILMLFGRWQMKDEHRADVNRLVTIAQESHEMLDTALNRCDLEREQWRIEREQWRVERQQLLDRIQSPSFAEYKQAEIKIIKTQNGEKEPPKLEVL